MTTPISAGEIPEDIGRNDPCPCGSGQKYKRCCFRAHQVQREAAKQKTSAAQLISPSTNPWKFFKLLQDVNENNMHALYHDMAHELGPFRARYADVTQFLQDVDAGKAHITAGSEFVLEHIRIDRPDIYMLLARGLDDPKVDSVIFDVVTLRPNEIDVDHNPRKVDHLGFRIWDVVRHTIAKSQLDRDKFSLADLNIDWHPSTFVRPVREEETDLAEQSLSEETVAEPIKAATQNNDE